MAKSNDFSCTLMGEVAITAAKAGWEPEDFSKLSKDENLMKLILGVLRNTHEIKRIGTVVAPKAPLDLIIRVDRSIRPMYPDWKSRVMHPELELTGPAEYDFNEIGLRILDKKNREDLSGLAIYTRLKKENALANCLGLGDLLAIQEKGIDVFRKHFARKAVFGFKSVVSDKEGYFCVPYLVQDSGMVVLSWHKLYRRAELLSYQLAGSPSLQVVMGVYSL
jgi:hypothetical protein